MLSVLYVFVDFYRALQAHIRCKCFINTLLYLTLKSNSKNAGSFFPFLLFLFECCVYGSVVHSTGKTAKPKSQRN